MTIIYMAVIFSLSLLLQSAVVPLVTPHWLAVGFELPLIVTVHIAVTRGKIRGMVSGMLLGYLQDALAGGIIGINGVAKILAGYMGGMLREKFFVNSLRHRLGSIFGAVAMGIIGKMGVISLFSLPLPSTSSLFLLWVVPLNTAFALLLHILLNHLEMRIGIRGEDELNLGS
jgi:rod shape-determining protein MreD